MFMKFTIHLRVKIILRQILNVKKKICEIYYTYLSQNNCQFFVYTVKLLYTVVF